MISSSKLSIAMIKFRNNPLPTLLFPFSYHVHQHDCWRFWLTLICLGHKLWIWKFTIVCQKTAHHSIIQGGISLKSFCVYDTHTIVSKNNKSYKHEKIKIEHFLLNGFCVSVERSSKCLEQRWKNLVFFLFPSLKAC